ITNSFSIEILDDLSEIFIQLLKRGYYIPNFMDEELSAILIKIKLTFNSFFQLKSDNEILKDIPLEKWIVFLLTKNIFEIKDLYFLNIIKEDFPTSIFYLQKKLKNIIFSVTIYETFIIYFFILNLINISKNNNNKINRCIFIYKNLPISLVEIIMKKIAKLYSIEIKTSVKYNFLKKHLKNNDFETIYSVESFNLESLNIEHTKVSLSKLFN
ncbi:MAG: hypothetical protein ACRCZR_08820, partial [Cetobacterium sp.]